MIPADSEHLTTAIYSQGAHLKQHNDQMSSLHRGVKELVNCQEEFKAAMSSHVNLLSVQVQEILSLLMKVPSSPVTPSPAAAGALSVLVPPATALTLSAPVFGESGKCRALIVDCEMHYEHLPSAFPTEQSKVAFMVSHLTGRAKAWATAERSRGSSICRSLSEFIKALRRAFDPITSDREKAHALSHIKQGIDWFVIMPSASGP